MEGQGFSQMPPKELVKSMMINVEDGIHLEDASALNSCANVPYQ